MTTAEVAVRSPRAAPRRGFLAAFLDAANEVGYRGVWYFCLLFLRVFYGLRVENRPTFPGPYILAPNHVSFLDPIVVQSASRSRIVFLMTAVYWGSRGANWWYRFCRALPVYMGGRSNRPSLAAAVRALRRGRILTIFPEGSRSRDGRLQRGRPGVAMIATLARVPVVPVALIGTDRALPVGARFLHRARIRVRFGEPLRFERGAGVSRRVFYRKATDSIMGALAQLHPAARPPA
ncbi:MAG: 1-acyl-sn-glycerol-3-phosphate acyltransferase [Planctomycetes bacterium]|nr:1-acyl-sn-glycerol-3-phosphate acyltransferase [Planctomycetota bacterium]